MSNNDSNKPKIGFALGTGEGLAHITEHLQSLLNIRPEPTSSNNQADGSAGHSKISETGPAPPPPESIRQMNISGTGTTPAGTNPHVQPIRQSGQSDSRPGGSMGVSADRVGGNRSRSYETTLDLFQQRDWPQLASDSKNMMLKAIELEFKSDLTLEEGKIISCTQEYFRLHSISTLPKRVTKFPKAKYFCSPCNYHLDSLHNVLNHLMSVRHIKNELIRQANVTMTSLCDISWSHQSALTIFITKTVGQYGMNEADQARRVAIVKRLTQAVRANKFEYELVLFGSSTSGFGFYDSDVNINVDVPSSSPNGQDVAENNTKVLQNLTEVFTSVDFCTDIREKRTTKWLTLSFLDTLTSKTCNIHLNNGTGVKCGELFGKYSKLDSRVVPIVTMFRLWARITDIQSTENGTLPGFTFSIMALHFLQEEEVIPIIHCEKSGLVQPKDEVDILESWESKNNSTLGIIWIALLKYFAEFVGTEKVVSMTQRAPLRKSDKAWNRKLSIEDPILPKTNLARMLSSNKVCDFIVERLQAAYIYFAIPRTKDGPLFSGVIPARDITLRNSIYYYKKDKGQSGTESLQGLIRQMQENCLLQQLKQAPGGKDKPTEKASARLVDMVITGSKHTYVVQEDVHLLTDVLDKSDYFYELHEEILRGHEKPPKFCKACSNDGHLKQDCPEETLPRMSRLTHDPTPFTLQVLSSVMKRNYENDALNENDVRIRHKITNEIYTALSRAFEDVELTMFGSTYNGFGLHMSDVDICLRLKDVQLSKAERQTEEVNAILKTVVTQLKEAGCMQEILAIPSAKVPIVKFRHRLSRLEGDISLSNILALHNTRLLRLYTEIDDRLKILGCFLKRLTKVCDISDASKGSLSSYGYVLMLIHFLQQHNPPVLPVLQELPTDSESRTPKMVEGCDAYFFSDLRSLPRIWPHYGKNRQSLSELWTAFVKYYAEVFQFDDQVITISQLAPLSRFSKFWLSETVIAIEDPFERTHNLGAGLSRRMGVHIVRTFQRFREIFTIPCDSNLNIDWLMFYCDARRIRGNNNPPVDRQCRICNRIGHFARNCTFTANDDRSYSYKDEEAPSHHSRPRNVVAPNRQPPPNLPNRGPQNHQNRQNMHGPATTMHQADVRQSISIPELVPNKQLVGSSLVFERTTIPDNAKTQSISNNGFPGPVGSNKSSTPCLVPPTKDGLRTSLNEPSGTPPQNDVQFIGFGSGSDSDRVIEAMISRNPGVVFQLNSEQNPHHGFGTSTSSNPLPEARHTYSSSQEVQALPPPPGFVRKLNFDAEEMSFFRGSGGLANQTQGDQSSVVGSGVVDGIAKEQPLPYGPVARNSATTTGSGPCAPPPGFSSIPIPSSELFPIRQASLEQQPPIYSSQQIQEYSIFPPAVSSNVNYLQQHPMHSLHGFQPHPSAFPQQMQIQQQHLAMQQGGFNSLPSTSTTMSTAAQSGTFAGPPLISPGVNQMISVPAFSPLPVSNVGGQPGYIPYQGHPMQGMTTSYHPMAMYHHPMSYNSQQGMNANPLPLPSLESRGEGGGGPGNYGLPPHSSPVMMNGGHVSPLGFVPYFPHQQQTPNETGIEQQAHTMNGFISEARSSPFMYSGGTTNKVGMMVMAGRGDVSTMHQGPVVSAVPAQTGHSQQHMVPFPHVPAGYPISYPVQHFPVHYAMMQPGQEFGAQPERN